MCENNKRKHERKTRNARNAWFPCSRYVVEMFKLHFRFKVYSVEEFLKRCKYGTNAIN